MYSSVTEIRERPEDVKSPDVASRVQRTCEPHGRHDPDSNSPVDRFAQALHKVKRFPVGTTGNRSLRNHPGVNLMGPTPIRVQRTM